MIEGSGFFALVDPATNEVSFTRNGAFSMASLEQPTGELDENGNLKTDLVYYLSDGNGRFVLGADGDMIRMTDPNEKQDVGIFDYANYNGMEHLDGTRFRAIDKNGDLTFGSGKLVQGMLETSNVDLAEEITKVIESQRAYSMALKMVQAHLTKLRRPSIICVADGRAIYGNAKLQRIELMGTRCAEGNR